LTSDEGGNASGYPCPGLHTLDAPSAVKTSSRPGRGS
jgi:hypothetical protein